MHTRKHIMIGLSGGVDSSVAAFLLKEQGFHLEAVFMKNWEEESENAFCPASIDFRDAQTVADLLQIELHKVNFVEEYWQNVFRIFLSEYQAGFTPNPDILCNKEIKFKAFLDFAKRRGADAIATGHYARTILKDGKYHLLKALDLQKDQSYFLHALNQEQLSQSLFPIGELTKPTIRQMAKKIGFKNHAKKDSTGICFIGERKFKTFLNDFLPAKPGPIQTLEGKIIGQHDGLMFYTIGQRQGLNIGGQKNSLDAPWYVIRKEMTGNILFVAQGANHPALFTQSLVAHNIHWIHEPCTSAKTLQAKTRYRQADQACKIIPLSDDQVKVEFVEPQRAVTPGQSVVFYQNEICLGGGIIQKTE